MNFFLVRLNCLLETQELPTAMLALADQYRLSDATLALILAAFLRSN
jgi:hypothetical protein